MQNRLDNLRELAGRCLEIYDEDAKQALATGKVPHYALLTSEGGGDNSYADNPNLTVHNSLESLARQIQAEANEFPSWTPNTVLDLDTGQELSWTLQVVFDAA
jgi:hypothetical protein